MELTIKKASDIRAATIAAADAIKINTSVRISIYGDVDVGKLITEATTKVDQQINDIASLIDVAFNIKKTIGEKNDQVGITSLMRDGKRIETQIAKLTVISKLLDPDLTARERIYGGKSEVDNNLAAIKERIELSRSRLQNKENTAPVEEQFSVTVISDTLREAVSDQLAALRRQKNSVSDNIAALNSNSKVTISDGDEIVLRRFKIL